MKDKRLPIIGSIIAVFFTAALLITVFTVQKVKANTPVTLDEPSPQVTEDIPADIPTEPGTENISANTPESSAAAQIKIGAPSQPQIDIKPEDVIDPNWVAATPEASDISEETAKANAAETAKVLFGLNDTTVKSAVFMKDMTAQRSSFWEITFSEDELCVSIDSLSGNVISATSLPRFNGNPEIDPEKFTELMNTLVDDETANKIYFDMTTDLANTYLSGGGIKNIELNGVGSDGKSYPFVSFFLEMHNGTGYYIHWGSNLNNEIWLCEIMAYPSFELLKDGWQWEADSERSYWIMDQLDAGKNPLQ